MLTREHSWPLGLQVKFYSYIFLGWGGSISISFVSFYFFKRKKYFLKPQWNINWKLIKMKCISTVKEIFHVLLSQYFKFNFLAKILILNWGGPCLFEFHFPNLINLYINTPFLNILYLRSNISFQVMLWSMTPNHIRDTSSKSINN